MAGNTLRLGVELDEGGVTKKLNGISQAFDKLGGPGSGASLFGNVGAKAVALGFNLISDAASGTIGFLDGAVHAAIEDQASTERLTQALKNNIPGWDGNTQAISDYIDMQTERGFSDDDTRASIGQLIGITHDMTQATRINSIAEDLARAKNISLMEATDLLTKAVQGNGRGLKSLGIDIGKTKDAAGILKIVQDNVRGSAEAWNNTMQGKLNKSQVKFNEAIEKIGYQLLPVVADIMQKFSDDWLPALGRGWQKVTDALRPVAKVLGEIVHWISQAIGWIDKMIKKLKDLNVASIAVPPIPGLGVIPHFASGGIVTQPTLAMVGERGPEAIVPLNGGGFGHSHDIYMDGRKVADAVSERQFYQQRRSAAATTRV